MLIHVGAVDDHPALLLGLRAALEGCDDIRLVAAAPTVPELLARGESVDVALLDLRLDDGSRPDDNVRLLCEAGMQVLIYTQGRTSSECRRALTAGALTVLDKADPLPLVLEAIREAADGVASPTPGLAQALERERQLMPLLSEREQTALALYAANLPAKSVARRMGVTEGTVKVFLRRVRAKYAAIDRPAQTKLELYQRALEDGLLDDAP